MRRLILALILVLTPAMASAAPLMVGLNEAVRMHLRSAAQDVIVGNPAIADVTVSDPQHLIVVGKAAGVTNLIVINAAGRAIVNERILVGASNAGVVTMTSGSDTLAYACEPDCRKVGDQAQADQAMSRGIEMGAAAAERDVLSAPAGQPGGVAASPTTP
jgi:hypothetical protein